MSDNIIQFNEQVIKTELKDLVKQSVEETLNSLLDQEAEGLPRFPSMSVQSAVRAIAQDIICVTSRLLPAMLR